MCCGTKSPPWPGCPTSSLLKDFLQHTTDLHSRLSCVSLGAPVCGGGVNLHNRSHAHLLTCNPLLLMPLSFSPQWGHVLFDADTQRLTADGFMAAHFEGHFSDPLSDGKVLSRELRSVVLFI